MKARRWLLPALPLLLALACGDSSQVVLFDSPSESSRNQDTVFDGISSESQETDDAFTEFDGSFVEDSSLRILAVDLVNEQRRRFGRTPLRLGDSTAAQLVAEEALANFALLDYTQDGIPTEVLYTATGGRGAVMSSGQISGYLDAGSVSQCRSALVICKATDPSGDLAAYIRSRLDEGSAHERTGLLFPDWGTLHVGVAYSDFTMVVVLQLEHQNVRYLAEPSVSGGLLRIELAPLDGASIDVIDIYHYPAPPSPEATLARTKVLSIYEPPSSSEILTLPDDLSVTADHWSTEDGITSIVTSLAGRLPGVGLYEVVVWAGSEIPASQYFLNLDDPAGMLSGPSVGHTSSEDVPKLEELRTFALELINADRQSHGVPPVRLGTNPAAQIHAEDALRSGYVVGHWTSGGWKPYMLYTQTGGVGVMAENAAGHIRDSADCDQPTVVCGRIDVVDAIKTNQWSMMYDDAHADWGHRDTIINPLYDTVNIGIAFTDNHVAYYQHFEYTKLAHEVVPSLDDGILELWVRPLTGLQIGQVAIYYDPPPTPRHPDEISRLTAYCIGGGFTDNCTNIEPIARVLKPPPAGSYYVDLESEDFVAQIWDVYEGGGTRVVADLRQVISGAGVYTVVIFSGAEQPEQLSMYSIMR